MLMSVEISGHLYCTGKPLNISLATRQCFGLVLDSNQQKQVSAQFFDFGCSPDDFEEQRMPQFLCTRQCFSRI